MLNKKILIGRHDKADFEDINLYEIDIKIDSGAYTSSLHCHEIEAFKKEDEHWVKCRLLDPGHELYNEKEYQFKVHKKRKIRSSNGISEERFSVLTKITLFNKKYTIELTLTERGEMKYPVLLGRKFITGKFVIDTSKKNLSFNKNTIVIHS